MQELGPAFERAHPGIQIRFNFGGSGALAQQIERGAPVSVFFAAASKPMDTLAAKGLIASETRRDVLRNEIVLIVPKDNPTIGSFQDLATASAKLIALGDPDSVPAGVYGREVLQALGFWAGVQPKLVLAKDVRQVLTYVETGEADAGIVYATDARESDRVRVAAVAPEQSHQLVVYPVAVVKGTRNADAARAFIQFLTGDYASGIFARHGFTRATPQ
jgi:molybdate transport system substrate-binding protein